MLAESMESGEGGGVVTWTGRVEVLGDRENLKLGSRECTGRSTDVQVGKKDRGR